MEVVTVTTRNGSGVATRIEKTTYDYDASGFRISALAQTDTDANGTWDTTTRTTFLADSKTPTGYTQVLRESTYSGSGVLTTTVDYSFGHDELTQVTRQYAANGTVTSETTLVFTHDGHGSVRVVTDLAAALQQLFVYDAYGQLLAIVNSAGAVTSGGGGTNGLANAALALTTLQYNGETFDSRIALQYLRARWYDAANGRFNRLDPFYGNQTDPQSFHKYTFTPGDPVNFDDPSGLEFTIAGFMSAIGIGGNLRGLNAGTQYVARQAAMYALQTGMEFLILKLLFPDADFDKYRLARTFFTNFVGNLVTGKIGNFWLRNLADIAINSASDIALGDEDAVESIVMNIAGSFGGEALTAVFGSVLKRARLGSPEVAFPVTSPESSSLLQRYLSEAGGRWGGKAVRELNHRLASELEKKGIRVTKGAGRGPEEWIPGPGGGTLGGTFVDITGTDGTKTIRIQTVNTIRDSFGTIMPTPEEAAAAARIRARFPNDILILVPKT